MQLDIGRGLDEKTENSTHNPTAHAGDRLLSLRDTSILKTKFSNEEDDDDQNQILDNTKSPQSLKAYIKFLERKRKWRTLNHDEEEVPTAAARKEIAMIKNNSRLDNKFTK